jgi:hypothetical protein
VDLSLRFTDTGTPGASAGGTLWADNAQVWDQTAVGNGGSATMPYCELRFPASPAQLVVSGLLGDLPAQAHLAWGTDLESLPTGGSLQYAVARAGSLNPNAVLTAPGLGYYGPTFTPTAVPQLDATAYGGYYEKATVTNGGWNPRAFSPLSSDAPGVYHVLSRYRTQDASPTLVQVRAKVEQTLLPWFQSVNTNGTVGIYYGPYVNPLAAGGVWTVADAGQLRLPPFTAGALTDGTKTYLGPRAEWVGSTGGGAEGDANWLALLPVDGSLLLGTFNNPSNGPAAVTAQYLWVYHDGLLTNRAGVDDGPAWTYSLEAVASPSPGHGAGGPGTTTSGSLNINVGADPALVLDPGLATAGNASGPANVLVGFVADNTGAVLPLLTEVSYSPLYLYPR